MVSPSLKKALAEKKALEEIREANKIMQESRRLKRDLLRDERFRNRKPTVSDRLHRVFTRSKETIPAVKKAAKETFAGGKRYAEYRMGEPERKESKPRYIQGRKSTYYKKIGPGRYKKVTSYRNERDERERSRRKPQRHSSFGQSYFGGGSDILGTSKGIHGMSSGIHGTSSDMFRRTI
jgi:hypothetical protein